MMAAEAQKVTSRHVNVTSTRVLHCSGGATAQQQQALSLLDQLVPPCSVVAMLVYRSSCETEKLIETLQRTLDSDFPFLFGRLEQDSKSKLLRVVSSEEGIPIELAESDVTIADFGKFLCTESRESSALDPNSALRLAWVPRTLWYSGAALTTSPLLTVRFTRLGDGGLVIGCSFSHSVMDLAGFVYWVRKWVEHTQHLRFGVAPSLPAVFRDVERLDCQARGRSRKRAVESVILRTTEEVKAGQGRLFAKMQQNGGLHTFYFSSTDVEDLLELAEVTKSDVSRNSLVCGHIWQALFRARYLDTDPEPLPPSGTMSKFGIVIDVRNRLRMSLPESYVQNTVLVSVAELELARLVEGPLRDAVLAVQSSVESMDPDETAANLAWIQQKFDEGVDPSNLNYNWEIHECFGWGLSCSNWRGFDDMMYGSDFGDGKALYCGPPFPQPGVPFTVIPGMVVLRQDTGRGFIAHVHLCESDVARTKTPEFTRRMYPFRK